MISREEALELVKKYIKSDKLVKHVMAVEAIMKKLAEKLNEDKNLWGLVGLLHDLDYEVVGNEFSKHGLVTPYLLSGKLSEEALNAIKAHNELTGFKDDSKLAIALKISDQVSGLIVSTTLVMPNKKLSEVKVSTLKRKFKQKDFARSIDREKILLCEGIGISLDEFLEISLKALQEINNQLNF